VLIVLMTKDLGFIWIRVVLEKMEKSRSDIV